MSKPTVFISYSHKDELRKDRVETRLCVLQLDGMLKTWTDRQIGAGDDRYGKIEEAMNRAAVGILLISANSLTSNFILREEVSTLIRRRDRHGASTPAGRYSPGRAAVDRFGPVRAQGETRGVRPGVEGWRDKRWHAGAARQVRTNARKAVLARIE